MRRARRSSLLALLLPLLTAQAPWEKTWEKAPGNTPEDSAHQQVEDSERVRAGQVDAQREAAEQAAQAQAEEQRLTTEWAEAVRRLNQAEAAVNDIAGKTLDLQRRRAEAQTRFDRQASVMSALLPVIVHVTSYPAAALLATQMPAEDAIRGLLILRGMAQRADIEARVLAADRRALDEAEDDLAKNAPLLAAAEAARSFEAEALADRLAAARTRLHAAEQDASRAARRAAAEAARATTLRSMLQILETQRRLEEAQAEEDALRAEREQRTAAASAARARQASVAPASGFAANVKPAGQLAPPVRGVLMRGWGDPENGEPATGQSYLTAPGAGVVAPCGGTVAFAEPFRGYGLLVIIDCGGGYHAVLAGMARLEVSAGLAIQVGNPVGAMREEEKIASAGAARGRPVLYMELRKGGRPVDPAPWLRTGE